MQIISVWKDIYIGLTLSLLLSLSFSTAVIADSTLIQQFIEKELIPLTKSNDDVDKVNECFSNLELKNIMEAAQENSIDAPDMLLNVVNQNKSEYEEVIMSFARKAFGGSLVEWTSEQKHWFCNGIFNHTLLCEFHQGKLLLHLFPHLLKIDEIAHCRMERLTEELLERNPAPDKATQQLAWIQHMNMLKAQTEEIIVAELIYS